MKLDFGRAQVYDTVFFLDIHYNYSYWHSRFATIGGGDSSAIENYGGILKSLEKIPALFLPLFANTPEEHSVFNAFWESLSCSKIETLQDLTAAIKENSDKLYSLLWERTFGEGEKNDLISAIEGLTGADSEKLQLSLLLGNWKAGVELLCETLEAVHLEVVRLHARERENIDRFFEGFQTAANFAIFEKGCELSLSRLQGAQLSVSLLNPFYVAYSYNSADELYLRCGLKYEISFSAQYQEGFPAAEQFVETCGSEMKIKMMRALAERGEMSLTDFASYLNAPSPTVIRCVRSLQDGNIIVQSRREAKFIYYKANTAFMKIVKNDMNALLDKLIGEKQ